MSDPRRRRTRVSGGFPGQITVAGATLPMQTMNVSLKGLLCHVEEGETALLTLQIAPGFLCTLTIELTDDLILTMEGRLSRVTPPTLAVDFVSMDPESYGHLRNIVRLSAPDPDAIDQEEADRPFSQ